MPDPNYAETVAQKGTSMVADTDNQPVAELSDVSKAYGDVLALDGLSLRVEPRSITCLVGPNGAGKTTAVECIEGLRVPDRGTVRVFGVDPLEDRQRLFRRVGVQLQESSVQVRLRVGEIVRLFASFFPDPADCDELLDQFGLSAKRDEVFEHLSGGQKRRLQIVLALIGQPDLVILDEPTSGLDPQARHGIWSWLREHRAQGRTVLVTTHYIEEAEDYADRVEVIDHGRIAASGSPADLLREHRLGVRVWIPSARPDQLASLEAHPAVSQIEHVDDGVVVFGPEDDVRAAVDQAIGLRGTEVRGARLEDLFLLLTGRAYREE